MSPSPTLMFIFPGQGSQYQGMGRDIYHEFGSARRVYEEASGVLGYDMAELSFLDPQQKLATTRYAQPALLTHSIACLEVFRELTGERFPPTTTAGHSLGEYSALVAAGSLTFENALQLVQERGKLMGQFGKGQMIAFPLDLETVRSFVDTFYCGIGGCNLPKQTVVGGAPDDLHRLAEYVEHRHRTTGIYLNTEGAFHTYLMVSAAEAFRPVLDSAALSPPTAMVLSNYSGDYHSDEPPKIKAHLFFQLFSPVKWIWSMQRAFRDKNHPSQVLMEFGGGIGPGEDPAGKRPNLESITRRALRSSHHTALYLTGINSETLRKAAHVVNALAKLRIEPQDDPPSGSKFGVNGTAVDENWFHLFVPTKDGIVTESSISLLRLVEELGIGDVVQLIEQPSEHNLEVVQHFFGPAIKEAEPYLELVVGCETACVLPYRGADAAEELHQLARRLRFPGYHFFQPSTGSDADERSTPA
jgi:malonyl CoA-acyl carrier protein transacylase